MREILFRGKNLKTGKWTQGYLFRCWERAYIAWGMVNNNADMVEVDPETVCQYTGLTDKNGKKIFERDIVNLPKCKNDIAVFSLIGCNYILKGKYSNYTLGSYESECFEVIGNIFDNPELLKGGTIK